MQYRCKCFKCSGTLLSRKYLNVPCDGRPLNKKWLKKFGTIHFNIFYSYSAFDIKFANSNLYHQREFNIYDGELEWNENEKFYEMQKEVFRDHKIVFSGK